MTTVTIPKELAKQGDLVLVPRREYEAFSQWRKHIKIRLNDAWFWTPEWQEKEFEADRAIAKGKVQGPFSNHKDLMAALSRKRT
ncbi:MAG: hypothetical protein AAB634_01235 [Patescibacteria group bacterium]